MGHSARRQGSTCENGQAFNRTRGAPSNPRQYQRAAGSLVQLRAARRNMREHARVRSDMGGLSNTRRKVHGAQASAIR
eukprot:9439782-Alexandrium_andersonii.AAC.1